MAEESLAQNDALTKKKLRAEKKKLAYRKNREKILAYAAKYRANNKEKVKAAMQSWREKNREHSKEYSRKHYRENRDLHLATMAKYRVANRQYFIDRALATYYKDIELGRAKCRAYRERDVKRHRERFREWMLDNPDKMRDIARRRRARIKGSTVETIRESEVFDRDGWCCYICDTPVVNDVPFGTPNKAVMEHVVALAKGGGHTMDNVRCACHRCNQMKGHRLTPEQVRERLRQTAG